ncbi:MAG: vWA domain-containing protein, partial [Candidatus Binatota bacterium]
MKDLFFVGALPWWFILLIALGALALLIHQFLAFRQRLSPRQSWLLISLRGFVYALLLFFLLSPGLVEKRVTRLRRPLTVILDSSQSMGFPASSNQSRDGRQGQSRLDLAKEKLLEGKEPLMQKLAQNYDLRLYQFNTRLEALGPASLRQLAAQGKGTRLIEALKEAGRDGGAQAGIILFSDGIANGENRSMNDSISFPVPIFAVGVGETQGYTDLRIADLSAPEFAFRGRELKIDLTVQAYGLAGKTVPLHFNRG